MNNQSRKFWTPHSSLDSKQEGKGKGRMILVPVATQHRSLLVTLTLTRMITTSTATTATATTKTMSAKEKNNMTQQQRGQEPRRRKNADPIECSYKMLEDATRIGSNSIPRDSMQECATVQFWRLDRGEDLLRWCHRTRRLILLIQNWNITSARPTRISFQVKSKLLRDVEGDSWRLSRAKGCLWKKAWLSNAWNLSMSIRCSSVLHAGSYRPHLKSSEITVP